MRSADGRATRKSDSATGKGRRITEKEGRIAGKEDRVTPKEGWITRKEGRAPQKEDPATSKSSSPLPSSAAATRIDRERRHFDCCQHSAYSSVAAAARFGISVL
jgi:hypothetical protein